MPETEPEVKTESATLSLGRGNLKVGRIPTFSLPAKFTCPGASEWCLKHCYAYRYERRRPNCRDAYSRNLVLSWNPGDFVKVMLDALPPQLPCLRIHVSGDFYAVEYIEAWMKICAARPNTLFWAYTRSWMVPDLLPPLEELRTLKNVRLFASVDPTMPLPPNHWRMAFIATDKRAFGILCPEQLQKSPSCMRCGYCFRAERGNVVFQVH